VVYVSTNTPFIAAVKRVRKYLTEIDKRDMGSVTLSKITSRKGLENLGKRREEGKSEAVYIRATGKAIEKAMNLGVYFQGQDVYRVSLRTGWVGAIDDVEYKKKDGENGEEEVVEEARVRRTSMLEVAVSLR